MTDKSKDTIFVRDLRVRGRHGVSDKERGTEQEFLIDISADFDTARAAQSDDLAHTVDYGVFREIAREAVEANSFYLIEKLAARIAEKILEQTPVTRIRVTIRKPDVWDNGVPGITVERSRA